MGEKKRVLGLVTSLRSGGNSEMLVRVALRAVAERGAQADILCLKDLRVGFCDGCLTCVFREGGCHHRDDVPWLWETAARYDGLIVASPTYLLGAPGQVKTLVDRLVAEMARAPGRPEVPVATICVAGLPGWDYLVRPVVNQLALLLGGKLVGSLMAYAPGPGEVLLDPDLVRRTEELGLAVLEDRSLPPPAGACPICHLPGAPAAGPCPFCLYDPAHPDRPHRFTKESLTHFLADWMLPSRERFLAHRAEVKAAVASLPSPGPSRLAPARPAERAPGGGERPGPSGN